MQTTTLVNRLSALLVCALCFAASPAFGQAFPVHDVSPLSDESTFPAMAVGPAGHAVVAWYAEPAGASVSLRVSRYLPSSDTWSAPVDLVSYPKANAQYRYGIDDVAIDSAGNAIVIMDRVISCGCGFPFIDVWATRYSVATGQWSPFAVLSPSSANDGGVKQVVMDGAGNALVIWSQTRKLHAAHYSPASGWTTRALANGGEAQVALDGTGNALVTFISSSGANLSIHALRYVASTGTWGAEQRSLRFRASISKRRWPWIAKVMRCSHGQIRRGWTASAFVQPFFRVRRYTSGTGWMPRETLSDNGALGDVVMDVLGNATAVWNALDGAVPSVQSARFDGSAGTWSGIATLSSSSPVGVLTYRFYGERPEGGLGTDSAGNVRITWQFDGTGGRVVQTSVWPAGAPCPLVRRAHHGT